MIISDTTLKAEAAQIALLQKISASRRFEIAANLSAQVVALARRAIARARPEIGETERDLLLVENCHGRKLAENLRRYLHENGRNTI